MPADLAASALLIPKLHVQPARSKWAGSCHRWPRPECHAILGGRGVRSCFLGWPCCVISPDRPCCVLSSAGAGGQASRQPPCQLAAAACGGGCHQEQALPLATRPMGAGGCGVRRGGATGAPTHHPHGPCPAAATASEQQSLHMPAVQGACATRGRLTSGGVPGWPVWPPPGSKPKQIDAHMRRGRRDLTGSFRPPACSWGAQPPRHQN